MNSKHKRLWIVSLTVIISAIFFTMQFCQGKHMNYYADSFSENLSLTGAHDVDISDNSINIIGEDPYLVYSLPEQGDYLNCKVIFSDEISSASLQLRIYYKDDISNFSEDKAFDVTVDRFTDNVCFSLPGNIAAVQYIRIDFDNKLSSVPAVRFVGLQDDSPVSRFVSFLPGLIYDYLITIPILLLVLVYALDYYFRNWGKESVQRDFAVIVIMAVSFFLLFFDYLLGDKAFSFYSTEIGNDSFQQTYPNLVSQANRIANGIWKEYVNFSQSLGNRVGSLVLGPGNWFCIFGEDAVIKWMGISHYLKVLSAGILAYFWAKIYGGNSETGFIIAFGYAMSTELTVRSAWNSYPNIALLLVFWLLAFELKHKKGKWHLLPVATILFFYSSSVYVCLVWGFLLALYILFRELADRKDKVEWRRWLHTELLYVLFAVVGMADTLITQLEATFSSTRVVNALSGSPLLRYGFLGDKKVIFTALLRTLGQTIMGISHDYKGYYNYLEGPAFYCGILFFLFVPISIYNLERRKRFYYILVVLAACLYIIVTPIRVVANGFSGPVFKLSSYWICIFMIILSMEILILIFSNKELKKGSIAIFQGTVVTAIILFLAACKLNYIARIDALLYSILFIVVYVIIMQQICSEHERKKVFLGILCLIFATETIVLSWPVINDRVVVNVDDMQKNKRYYNDYTVDAVKFLDEKDEGWHRLEKAYSSVFLCDSLAQNYYGVESYIGGTEADPGIIAIYQALELTRQDSGYHYLMGTGGNVYASALLGSKYYLTKNREVDRYGLQYLSKVGNVAVYENELALPIAYTYGRTVSERDFEQLSVYDRSRNILNACIVNTQNATVESVNPLIFDFSDLSEYELVYEKTGGTYQVNLDEDKILIVRMMMSKEGYQQPINFIDSSGNVMSSERITYSAGEKVIEICLDNLRSVRFSDTMCDDMESIEFYAVDAEQYYADLRSNVTELQNHAMKITAHDEIYNYIEGTVNCEQPRVLATSIPISDNWKIIVDGQAVEDITVNKGFVGCYLDVGEHNIIISYDGKSWLEANVFKIIGFITSLGVLVIRVRTCVSKRRLGEFRYE